ncbi:MAG: hypothetical protein GX640_17715 [Fibrobacter sp.]|nr:hypothetical protein [Fibrobacter sp.]
MNKIKTISCILILSSILWAKTLDIKSILLTVINDNNIEIQNKMISDLKSSSKYIPYIDEVELRINSAEPFSKTENLFQRQKYALRISPNGFGESVAAKKVISSTMEYHVHRKEKLLNSLLKDRYLLVIEMLFNYSLLNRNLEMKELLEDRISVLEKMINTENFDFSDIVKAETDYSKLQLDIIELQNLIHYFEVQINTILPYTDSVEIDTSNIIDVATLKRELQRSIIKLDSNNIYLKDCLLKFKTAQNLFQFETKTKRKVISFLEFELDADKLAEEKRDNAPEYNKALSFGFGISIPILNSDRIDVNRKLLKMLDDNVDYINEKKNLEDSARMLQEEINALIEQYEFLTERSEMIKTESFLGKYAMVDGENPLILLKIRQSIIRNGELMDEVKYKIYKKYIQMMDITGKLSEYPLRNFLSKNREIIQ